MARDRGVGPLWAPRQFCCMTTPAGPRVLGCVILLLLVSVEARAQRPLVELSGAPLIRVDQRGPAAVLEAEGPALSGRREFYRPASPLRLRHRWLMVQDSTFAVVFAAPAGVTAGIDSYEAGVSLRALRPVMAVEVRALLFDVWGDAAGYLALTDLDERRVGDRWELRPRWRHGAADRAVYRTSLVWIHRVMLDDETVVEADLEAVGAAWRFLTGNTFPGLPAEGPSRADRL